MTNRKRQSIETERNERTEAALKLLRSALFVLADLAEQGWLCRIRDHGVEIAQPEGNSDLELERSRVRHQLHVQRDRQLLSASVRDFISTMERRRYHHYRWTSIFSLMRDGTKLASQLHRVRGGSLAGLKAVIQPYIQIVDGSECEHTGLRLGEIWRYFRHTWANPYRSVPGRSLMLLIRDSAAEFHPVVGIAAIASSAVQIGVRDEWIGWSPEAYVNRLRTSAAESDVIWLLQLVENGLAEIYQDDFLDPACGPLTRRALAIPTPEVINWLQQYGKEQRKDHHRLVDANAHKQGSNTHCNENGDTNWRTQAETQLFRSKRAETMSMLLRARAVLSCKGKPINAEELRSLLASPDKRQAVQSLIRRAKSERVGVAMADISVCGAIPPYSALLGGKLVSMLVASPEVIAAYRSRYADQQSVIASSVAGRPIVRPTHLVFLGTTSLYGTEPTQYTRVHVPCERLGGKKGESVRYRLLGKTEGYGTAQFSEETVDTFADFLAQKDGGQRVNSIFGEGVNPRLRKIRDGLEALGLPSDLLLEHGSPRLVYGVALARNFREFLLGLHSEPEYLFPLDKPARATRAIAEWWTERWLNARIQKEEVLKEVARNNLTYPILHGARVAAPEDDDHPFLPFGDIANQKV